VFDWASTNGAERLKRGTADPDFLGSAAVIVDFFRLEGLAVVRSWGFESPLPHQPSLMISREGCPP
jgi:hypothetical protein